MTALHRYRVRYTTRRCLQIMKTEAISFRSAELETFARENAALFEKEIAAFTAADAIVQLNVMVGFDGQQLPFLFAVEPLPAVLSPIEDDDSEKEDT